MRLVEKLRDYSVHVRSICVPISPREKVKAVKEVITTNKDPQPHGTDRQSPSGKVRRRNCDKTAHCCTHKMSSSNESVHLRATDHVHLINEHATQMNQNQDIGLIVRSRLT